MCVIWRMCVVCWDEDLRMREGWRVSVVLCGWVEGWKKKERGNAARVARLSRVVALSPLTVSPSLNCSL